MAERTIRYWNVLVGTHLRTWHDPLLPVPWKSYRGETYHPPFRVYSPGRLNYSKSGLGLGLHGQSRLAGFSPFFKDKINWCFNTAYRSQEGWNSYEEPSSFVSNSGAGVSHSPFLPASLLSTGTYFHHPLSFPILSNLGHCQRKPFSSCCSPNPNTYIYSGRTVFPLTLALFLWLTALSCCTNEYDSRF